MNADTEVEFRTTQRRENQNTKESYCTNTWCEKKLDGSSKNGRDQGVTR